MIKVHLKNQDYTIEWEYYHNKINYLGKYDEKSNRHSTTCRILDERGEKICVGFSANHSNDIFVKEVGRRRALENALNWIPYFSKAERKLIWKTYFSRKKDNKIRTDKKVKKIKKLE